MKHALSFLAALLLAQPAAGATVLVEAEGFDHYGGWVDDSQFMDQMGSPFLLAHGLGTPVDDATTTVARSMVWRCWRLMVNPPMADYVVNCRWHPLELRMAC